MSKRNGRNLHHLFWPKGDYKTDTELEFRALPCFHIVIGIEEHRLVHAHTESPTKPSFHEMDFAIQRHKFRECGCYETPTRRVK